MLSHEQLAPLAVNGSEPGVPSVPEAPLLLSSELDLYALGELARSAGNLAMAIPQPSPESMTRLQETHPAIAPIAQSQGAIGYNVARQLPHVINSLPHLEAAKSKFDSGQELEATDIEPLVPVLMGALPAVELAANIAPAVMEPHDAQRRQELHETYTRPFTGVKGIKLKLLRAGYYAAAFVPPVRRLMDRKIATHAAAYINDNRKSLASKLEVLYADHVAPFLTRAHEFVDTLPVESPRTAFKQETQSLANHLVDQAEAAAQQQRRAPSDQDYGHAVLQQLHALADNPTASHRSWPLLSKLGLSKLARWLPEHVTIKQNSVVEFALSDSGVEYTEGKPTTNQEGDLQRTINIKLPHVISIVGSDVRQILQSINRTHNSEPIRPKGDFVPHPLRPWIAEKLPDSNTIIHLLGAIRDLLPEDRARAKRLLAALDNFVQPKKQ